MLAAFGEGIDQDARFMRFEVVFTASGAAPSFPLILRELGRLLFGAVFLQAKTLIVRLLHQILSGKTILHPGEHGLLVVVLLLLLRVVLTAEILIHY